MRKHPDGVYSSTILSSRMKIPEEKSSSILVFLKNEGYLDSVFTGGKIHTITKGNKNTILTWKPLVEPIEAVVLSGLNPRAYKDFYKPRRFYNNHINIRTKHVQRMLSQYDIERAGRGTQGSVKIDRILINLPKKIMKLSEIVEIVNKRRMAKLSSEAINYHLNRFVELGTFEKLKRGFYRKIRNFI